VRRSRRVVVDQRRAVRLRRRAVSGAEGKLLRQQAAPDHTEQRRTEQDGWERQPQGEDADERRRGNRPQQTVLQRPRTNAPGGMRHDRGHRRLDAIEGAGHEQGLAVGYVQPGQRDQYQQRGQYEQQPGDRTPGRAMQQPPDVSRELLRLRPRQQHAIVQRMQETALRNPASSLHQFLVHDGNPPGRTTEADQTQFQPEARRQQQAHRGLGGGAHAMPSVAERRPLDRRPGRAMRSPVCCSPLALKAA
jgi:hypothetical protein